MTKEIILDNLTKQGNVSGKFLEENDTTEYECSKIVHGMHKCKYCSDEPVFITFKRGYKDTCSSKDCKKASRKEKTERTNLERYGVKNISQLKEIKDRKQESYAKTCLEKYGVDNVFKSKDIMYKNGIHVTRTEEVNDKRNNKLIDLYGTSDPLSINNGRDRGIQKCNNDPVVKWKREKTCQEKYGGASPFDSEDFQEYIRSCNVDRFGVENNMHREDVKEIHKSACIERDNRRKEDIDEDGLNSFERVSKERKEDIDEDGLNSYHRAMLKTKQTNIDNGSWLSDDMKSDFELYYREVWKHTNRNDISELENIEKRGHANKNMYHLDHKYSIYQGFKDNIPAKIIGSIYNLEMILGRNNLSKGRNCSISKERLLKEYNEK